MRTTLLWVAMYALALLAGGAIGAKRTSIRVNPTVAGRSSAVERQSTSSSRDPLAFTPPTGNTIHSPYYGARGAATGTLQCGSTDVLAVTYESSASGDGKIYGNLVSYGLLQVKPGDYFEYEYMWGEPDCNCGAEFEVGVEYRLRDHGPLDQNGYSSHSEKNANMSQRVTRKWYYRRWDVSSLSGKYIDKWVFSALLRPGLRRIAYYRYVRLVRPGEPDAGKKVWEGGMAPIAINTYFPGTITSKCQSLMILEGAEVTFTVNAPPLETPSEIAQTRKANESPSRPRSVVLSTTLIATSLNISENTATATAGTPSLIPPVVPAPTCPYQPTALGHLRALESARLDYAAANYTTRIFAVSARLRHVEYPALTLWSFTGNPESPLVSLDTPRELPVVLSFTLPLPPASPLTTLLARAQWEVNVTTATVGIEGFVNTTIVMEPFSQVARGVLGP
jgi:hypothetical protein